MSGKVSIDQLAQAVNQELKEYSEMAADVMKNAVRKAGTTARKGISAGAPSRTGKYKGSWRTKKTKETSTKLEVTVYSPSRYMLAHLLEHGHAKRGGGRVRAFPHIAPAEETAEKQLIQEIEGRLRNG